MKRRIEDINEKIKKGDVAVISADDLSDMVRNGEDVKIKDVDVVTTATRGCMSGTAAVLSFRFSEPGIFERGKMVRLNGIPAIPGPAPNERAGYIDTIVYGTQKSLHNPGYGGGYLFKDLVKGKEIEVEVDTTDGRTLEETLTIEDTNTARIIGFRNCCKNYQAFTNSKEGSVKTIFHPKCLDGPYKECSFAGCGELNPIQNDPDLEAIGIGSKILMNGAEGMILGHGTKSTIEHPFLMTTAEMYDMKPAYMGGTVTSAGVEVLNTIAIPIPILDENILENAKVLDEVIDLPLVGIHDRREIGISTYGMVWRNNLKVSYDPGVCKRCDECLVEEYCPEGCFKDYIFEEERCRNCGFCTTVCDAFKCDMGDLHVICGGEDMKIPVAYRASDRMGARKASLELKDRIESGDFLLSSFERMEFKRRWWEQS
jgi:putative methanogenesis marker 16 metalloprotein